VGLSEGSRLLAVSGVTSVATVESFMPPLEHMYFAVEVAQFGAKPLSKALERHKLHNPGQVSALILLIGRSSIEGEELR
jgi:hypothetical protein